MSKKRKKTPEERYADYAEKVVGRMERMGRLSAEEGEEVMSAMNELIPGRMGYLGNAHSYKAVLRCMVGHALSDIVKANLPHVELVIPKDEWLVHVLTKPRLSVAVNLVHLEYDPQIESAYSGRVSWDEWKILREHPRCRMAARHLPPLVPDAPVEVDQVEAAAECDPSLRLDVETALEHIAKVQPIWARRVETFRQYLGGADRESLARLAGVTKTVIPKDVKAVLKQMLLMFPEFYDYIS